MASEYIQTSAKTMYHSEPDPRNYPLKGKYRAGWITAPHHNRHSDNQGKNRHKIPNPTSYATPRVMVMDLKNGRGRKQMMTREQFAALDWGWKIEDRIKQ